MTKENLGEFFSRSHLKKNFRKDQIYFQQNDIDFTRESTTEMMNNRRPTDDSDKNSNKKSNSVTQSCTKENYLSKCIATKEGIGNNAARERSRVHQLKQAFDTLQKALPNVPEGTKLSKLDILLLATNHISHLMSKLSQGYVDEHLKRMNGKEVLHPIKKWPMRTRLFVMNQWMESTDETSSARTNVITDVKKYKTNASYQLRYNEFESKGRNHNLNNSALNNEKEWYQDEVNHRHFIEKNKGTNYSINQLLN